MPHALTHELPRLLRLSALALGKVDGRDVRSARNPVSAWIVGNQPGLGDEAVPPDVLGTIRSRTDAIDEEIEAVIASERARDGHLLVWSIGAGLDARWAHLLDRHTDVVSAYCEVEEPDVLEFKHAAMSESPWSNLWSRVGRTPARQDDWRVIRGPGARILVVLDGACARLSERRFGLLLDRLRQAAADGWVIVDLPLEPLGVRRRWSSRALHRLGWQVLVDRRVEPRSWLVGPAGNLVCSGSLPYRVVVLRPRAEHGAFPPRHPTAR
jgi:hypothetical protein